MACYNPQIAWRLPTGAIFFGAEKPNSRYIELPCGNCIGCRLQRATDWANRCMHEAQMHPHNAFITLTYDDKHLPHTGGLNHNDFQLFMKRLRRWRNYFDVTLWQWQPRYFMCGEYGAKTNRPHYHALLFGIQFNDQKKFTETLRTSEKLTELWGMGHASIGDVTYESARYVATYACKKDHRTPIRMTLDETTGEAWHVPTEYGHMSLKPGIGTAWWEKYGKETYEARDAVVRPKGKTDRVPRYYDALRERIDPKGAEDTKEQRLASAAKRTDNSTQRLRDKEKVTLARLEQQRKEKI